MKDNAEILASGGNMGRNDAENLNIPNSSENQEKSEREKEVVTSVSSTGTEREDTKILNQKSEVNVKKAEQEHSASKTDLTGTPSPSNPDTDPACTESSIIKTPGRAGKKVESHNAADTVKTGGSKSAAKSDPSGNVKNHRNGTSEKLMTKTGKVQNADLDENRTAGEIAENGSGMKSSGSGRKNYSTAYTVYRTKIYTSDVIKYFQKKTFSVINNCLFNLCMVRPIHMEDTQYDQLYRNLCMIFNNTEKQIESAQEKFAALFSEKGGKTPDIYYTSPLETELQLKTPMSLRYVKILEKLDLLLQTIDKAHNAGFIVNPRDAVKLKFQWTRQIFMFTGEIRDLDNGRIINTEEEKK